MANTKITILGTSGSGKTCYLVGMYNKMCAGMKGYSIQTDDNTDVRLRDIYKNIRNNTGLERFPNGTDQKAEYNFHLQYAFNDIMEFDWVDYPGGLLDRKATENAQEYTVLKQIIKQSSVLFLCIDGTLLQGDDTEEKIENITEDCGKIFNTFLSYYKENNTLPPIAIVISKYDLCKNDTDEDEIEEIMQECFSPLFEDNDEKQVVVIIPVSLGENISENNYLGKVKPVNIYLPIFMGIWYSLYKEIAYLLRSIYDENSKIQDDIEDEKWWWSIFQDKEKIAKLQNKLSNNKQRFDNIYRHLEKYGPKLKEILDNKLNMVYLDGHRQDNFSAIQYS